MDAIALIQHNEGLRLRGYIDTRSRITIGYGRNLSESGISGEEALMLLQADYTAALNAALGYTWFSQLNEPRQAVVVDMIFNLGAKGFAKFYRLGRALAALDFSAAAAAMLNSAWAAEVPNRAHLDAAIMDTGSWPSDL